MFVLCTTESARLLPTIRSRCQRFAFTRPGAARDRRGAATGSARPKESRPSDEALRLMARAGGGSFRDSPTTLDQLSTRSPRAASRPRTWPACSTSCPSRPSTSPGRPDRRRRQPAVVLRRLDELAAEGGQDLAASLASLLEHLRLLYLLQHSGELPVLGRHHAGPPGQACSVRRRRCRRARRCARSTCWPRHRRDPRGLRPAAAARGGAGQGRPAAGRARDRRPARAGRAARARQRSCPAGGARSGSGGGACPGSGPRGRAGGDGGAGDPGARARPSRAGSAPGGRHRARGPAGRVGRGGRASCSGLARGRADRLGARRPGRRPSSPSASTPSSTRVPPATPSEVARRSPRTFARCASSRRSSAANAGPPRQRLRAETRRRFRPAGRAELRRALSEQPSTHRGGR